MNVLLLLKRAGVCAAAALRAPVVLPGCSDPSAPTATASAPSSTAATTTIAATTPTTLPTQAPIPTVGWCNATTLHVRSGPGTNYGSIGGLRYGEKVTIIGKEGDWYCISRNTEIGYVSAQYIQDTEVTGDPPQE